jgi:predicted RNase H-like HicB family nuclease
MRAEVATAPGDRTAAYLRRPYARIVIPEIDGTYRGEILEFPGCIATGDTPAETLDSLEEVAAAWLAAALAQNQPIPEPAENTEFSGRLVLRMPKSLHKKAAQLAGRDGVSLNQFIVTSLAEQIGERGRSYNQITFNNVIMAVEARTMLIPSHSEYLVGFLQGGYIPTAGGATSNWISTDLQTIRHTR